eukprot:3011797-Pleurochrysis_carterae.AAC.2
MSPASCCLAFMRSSSLPCPSSSGLSCPSSSLCLPSLQLLFRRRHLILVAIAGHVQGHVRRCAQPVLPHRFQGQDLGVPLLFPAEPLPRALQRHFREQSASRAHPQLLDDRVRAAARARRPARLHLGHRHVHGRERAPGAQGLARAGKCTRAHAHARTRARAHTLTHARTHTYTRAHAARRFVFAA